MTIPTDVVSEDGIKNLIAKTVEDFDHTMNVDVRGIFLGMKYAIPEMEKIGEGAIVNIASVAGLVADPSEIAGVALFLASPMAKFMSGSIVTVDAGQTSH